MISFIFKTPLSDGYIVQLATLLFYSIFAARGECSRGQAMDGQAVGKQLEKQAETASAGEFATSPVAVNWVTT
jgi:hypothetical protein